MSLDPAFLFFFLNPFLLVTNYYYYYFTTMVTRQLQLSMFMDYTSFMCTIHTITPNSMKSERETFDFKLQINKG